MPSMPLAPDNYSWKVVAINTYGEAESSVWTFVENAPLGSEVNLVVGWNLVSFTAVGAGDTPNNVFTDLTYYADYIIYYWSVPGGPYNVKDPDTAMLDNVGYWIYVNTNKTVSKIGRASCRERV